MSKVVGYCRVSTKGKLEWNSIEEQKRSIKERYSNAEIVEESYSGVKERHLMMYYHHFKKEIHW